MARPKNPVNYFKTSPIPQGAETAKGMAGYDNPRENIDPHIKTKVLNTKELIISGALINPQNYVPYNGGTQNVDLGYHDLMVLGNAEFFNLTVDYDFYVGNIYAFEDQITNIGSAGLKFLNVYCMGLIISNPATLTINDFGNLITTGKISGASLTAVNGFTGTITTASLVGKTITVSGGIIIGFA